MSIKRGYGPLWAALCWSWTLETIARIVMCGDVRRGRSRYERWQRMIRRLVVSVTVAMALVFPLIGTASAQELHLDLPPGIAKQVEPLMMDMMAHMDEMELSDDEMAMMMEEMQMMADQLPPGIFLQLLQVMVQLDMSAMMEVHEAMLGGDLMQQPPGQILRLVKGLAN